MEQNKKNLFAQVVGEFLIQHLAKNPHDAEKVVLSGKTIVNSIHEMQKVARGRQVDRMAGFTGEEGMAIVFEYFGIGTAVDVSVMDINHVAHTQKPVSVKKESKADFDVSLDDFI